VRELLKSVEQAHGKPLNIIGAERRAGDPPTLVAGAEKVREILGWEPNYDDLAKIAESSLAWERQQLESPWTQD